MGRKKLYREYDDEGKLVKLECGRCGIVKYVSEFRKHRGKKDGVNTFCRECKSQHSAQYRQDNADIEIKRIYKNVTQKLYPNSGVQYGIIYGVYCTESDRWYVGQTQTSFQHRYHGDFFTNKVNELSDSNDKKHLLQQDIEKFGAENFEIHEVLDVAFSARELDEKEVYYIDKYNSYMEGYNSNRGFVFGRDTIYEN